MNKSTNKELIEGFYAAFAAGDFVTMQHAYADDAVFSDAVFRDLNSRQVKAMWEMLLKSAKDLKVNVSNINADDANGSCTWEATYTFSATGRKVHNIIQAEFMFKDGKIVRHHDRFDFYRWSRMAFGFKGLVLGWTDFFQDKVRHTARARLGSYMSRNRYSIKSNR